MQISSQIQSFTPRKLNVPQPPQDPQEPKGKLEFDNDSFGERFVSNYTDTSDKVSGFLYPTGLAFAGNRLGSLVGAMTPLGEFGGLVGGICGSIIGYGFGRKTLDGVSGKVEDLSGNNKAQQFLVKTAFTAAVGAGTLGALAGFSPQALGIGAGLAVGATAVWSAFQSK